MIESWAHQHPLLTILGISLYIVLGLFISTSIMKFLRIWPYDQPNQQALHKQKRINKKA
jgi:hypothetical protein